MDRIAPLALLLLVALTQSALANDLNLQQIWQRSDAVVLAQVPDVPTDLTPMPVPGARPFQRQRRHFRVLQVLRGHVPGQVDVDEAGWRAEYAALVQCAGRNNCLILLP